MECFYEETRPEGGRVLNLELTEWAEHSHQMILEIATALCRNHFPQTEYDVHISGEKLLIVFPRRKSRIGRVVCDLLGEVFSYRMHTAIQWKLHRQEEAYLEAERARRRALRAEFGLGPLGGGL